MRRALPEPLSCLRNSRVDSDSGRRSSLLSVSPCPPPVKAAEGASQRLHSRGRPGPMDPSTRGGGGGGDGGGPSGDGNDQILWDWQGREHSEPTDANQDVAKFVWDCLNRDDDEDELMGLLENQTPLRDCRAFFDIGDITCKETLDPEESRESKRRRVLEYPSESSQPEVGDHEMGSNFVTSEVTETSLLCTDEPQSLNWDVVQHNSNDLDKMISLSNGAPYETSDSQLEIYSDGFTPEQMPSTQESVTYVDCESDVPGTSAIVPVTESLIMQETRKLSTLKVSKAGSSLSSLVKVKQNITTTIAYPFTLIKPSWEEGDVTLKDINQRIHAPPKPPPENLGTSAFSGKPVIGKTRIRTEGGKGSITILRTKG